MAPNTALLRRMVTPQRSWRREDAFDAVFALRMVVAAVLGVAFGVAGCEGFPFFLAFFVANFGLASAWLSYQDINVEEMDSGGAAAPDAMSPSLLTEGFGPSLPLFVLTWTALFTVLHN